MKAAFSSRALVPSVTRMSSQKLAKPCSANDLLAMNHLAGSISSTTTAVTSGSLCRISVDSCRAALAISLGSSGLDRGVAYWMLIIGITCFLHLGLAETVSRGAYNGH